MQIRLIIAVVLASSLSLTGCMSASKSNVTVTGTTIVSKGQELTDLQRALDAGAISQSNYEKVRTKLLQRK